MKEQIEQGSNSLFLIVLKLDSLRRMENFSKQICRQLKSVQEALNQQCRHFVDLSIDVVSWKKWPTACPDSKREAFLSGQRWNSLRRRFWKPVELVFVFLTGSSCRLLMRSLIRRLASSYFMNRGTLSLSHRLSRSSRRLVITWAGEGTYWFRSDDSYGLNLLRWNDVVPRTSRIFCPKVAVFSQFWVYLDITRAKQMINLLLLSNFCPVIPFWQIQNDILTNYCTYTVWSLVMVREPIASARG